MLPAASFVDAAALFASPCETAALGAVVRDADDSAPFVIETPDGRRFRALGTDFVRVSTWKPAEPLRICRQEDRPPSFGITNIRRGEAVVAAPVPERVFADTCVARGSGDTAGWIVALSGPVAHPRVMLEWSEGAMMGPAAATAHYAASGGRLRFRLSVAHRVTFRFEGVLRAHELAGVMRSPWEGARPVTLVETDRARAERPASVCPPPDRRPAR